MKKHNPIRWRSSAGAVLLAAVLVGGPMVRPAAAAEHSAGVYVATGLLNVLYLPAKVFFAGGGAVVSGLAWAFTAGNDRVANSIWHAAVDGNYVVTPAMIEGKKPIHFVAP